MVFDPEPRKTAPPVSVRIPGEEESPFTPTVIPKPAPAPAPAPKAEEKKAAPAPEEKKSAPAVEAKKSSPAEAERKRAEAALAGGEFVVQVGVFSNPKDAIAKLSTAKIPYYTEPAGSLTRVRAGPFATRAEAEKALDRLKSLGLKPGGVTTRS